LKRKLGYLLPMLLKKAYAFVDVLHQQIVVMQIVS